MKKIVILGAGISGLATGWYLKERFDNQIELTIHERSSRVGGWIHTLHKGGFLFEAGPRGFRPSGKGKVTLDLVKELGLAKELVAADKRARKRYICLGGKLRPFSLGFLLRQGLIGALLRDLRTPATSDEDESIAHFTSRRFGTRLTENLIDPLTKGIFGGDAKNLSMRACFPSIWKYEQQKGSVIKGLFASRKEKKEKPPTSLYSFREGMETLPNRLAEALNAHLVLSSDIPSLSDLDADLVISALPTYALADLLQQPNPLEFSTLATVSFGWNKPVLKKRGYGFLVPSKEKSGILGMTWDSEIFPEQNKNRQTRLCVMIGGHHAEEALYCTALESLKTYLAIDEAPEAYCIRVANNAIPQYTLHHLTRIEAFKKSLPSNLVVVGNSYEGVGVNDCIANAKNLVHALSL